MSAADAGGTTALGGGPIEVGGGIPSGTGMNWVPPAAETGGGAADIGGGAAAGMSELGATPRMVFIQSGMVSSSKQDPSSSTAMFTCGSRRSMGM